MVLRATFIAVRAASFLGALVAFLLSMLFLPGGPFDAPTQERRGFAVAATALYSLGAGVGSFLLFFGAWSYRVQTLVVRLRIGRLFFVRTALLALVFAAAAVTTASLAWVGFAQVAVIVGSLLAAMGLVAAFVVRGRAPRARYAWTGY